MPQTPYIFNQLCSFIPKDVFDRLVKKYGGNYRIKDYSCWNHLLVMVWAQLTSRRSLRDIEASLRSHSDKVYRMGMGVNISRSNISKANSQRSVAIYRELAQVMMRRTGHLPDKDGILSIIRKRFRYNGFFAVDSTIITLGLDRYKWSAPQQGWGGVKVHTMYDLLRCVPRMCLITGHEERDQTFMEDYPYESGCFYMFDKMYFKTRGLYRVHKSGAFFVIRIKENVVYEVTEDFPVDGTRVLAEQAIRFTSRWASQGYPGRLRLVRFYSSEKNAVMSFVSNNFDLDGATIALLYKYRWQIEVFFKWIKQHLRITSFFGTSANAVMIQIYTACITFCILALAADNVGFKGSLYEFSNIASVSLVEKVTLTELIKRYQRSTEQPIKETLQTFLDFDILS